MRSERFVLVDLVDGKDLLFGQDGDRYLVLASRRGADHHPEWYLNLEACPDVDVQVLDDKFAATARIADVDERLVLWPRMVAVWPEYDDYQARTERVIPLVIIERAEAGDRRDGA